MKYIEYQPNKARKRISDLSWSRRLKYAAGLVLIRLFPAPRGPHRQSTFPEKR